MPRDPFDELNKKIEEMFRRAMQGEGMSPGTMASSISVQRVGDKTKIRVSGDVPEDEIERLKQEFPNAEINVDRSEASGTGPVEVLEDESENGIEKRFSEEEESPEIEELDEESAEPEELALKRFEEKEKEE